MVKLAFILTFKDAMTISQDSLGHTTFPAYFRLLVLDEKNVDPAHAAFSPLTPIMAGDRSG